MTHIGPIRKQFENANFCRHVTGQKLAKSEILPICLKLVGNLDFVSSYRSGIITSDFGSGGGGVFGARRVSEDLVPTLLGSPCRGSVWLMTQELRSTLHPPSRRTSDMLLSEHITSPAASRILAFHHLMNEQRTPATDSGPSNQNKLPTLICPQTSSTTKQLKGSSLNFTSRRGHKIHKDVSLNLARTKCAQNQLITSHHMT